MIMPNVDLREIGRSTCREDMEGKNVHDHLKHYSVEELKKISMSDRFPFAVMCFSLAQDGNVAGCVRSAVLHGAEKVWIFGRRKFDRRPAVGSLNYIDCERIDGFVGDSIEFDLDKFSKIIDENHYWPVFIEQGGVSITDYHWNVPFCKKILLVLGNETNGIPNAFMDHYKGKSDVISIPQRGVIRSFNVSNAMNIASWDLRLAKNWI